MSIEELRLSIYNRLLQKYSHDLIPASAAGAEIKEMSSAAVRIAIHRKIFPVPTAKVMGTQMVRLADLSAFLADPLTTFAHSTDKKSEPVSLPSESRRGRGQRGPGKRRQVVVETLIQGRG
ncbi:MAG: hypothetical protein ACYC2E_14435 [Sulfuricella sp.]